jgi:hypothetical protein
MILAVSTLLMAVFIVVTIIVEYVQSKKSPVSVGHYDAVLDDLKKNVDARYVQKFGKDPTGSFPSIKDKK